MLARLVNDWIDATNQSFIAERQSCSRFVQTFEGFYPGEFLAAAFYVAVDELPKPDLPELHEAGLGSFLNMDAIGITYKDTYYVRTDYVDAIRLHFHELVHVAQWQHLGAEGFLNRYAADLRTYGYRASPLEKMAYDLELHYLSRKPALDVPGFVAQELS